MDRVLVVEDEPSLRTDLVDYLSAKGFAAEGVASVAETRGLLRDRIYDAVILDIGLPDGDGFDILGEIRDRGLTCAVMVLTAFGHADDRVKGLDGGADAYLVKKATLREIEATLRSILRRRPSGSDHRRFSGWTVDREEWQLVAPNGVMIKLTGNEMAFAVALADCGDSPCPREKLAATIGRSMATDDRNLDALVRRFRRKVEVASGIEAPIRVVYGVGYAWSALLRIVG